MIHENKVHHRIRNSNYVDNDVLPCMQKNCLSGYSALTVSPELVTRQVLLDTIRGITIASAKITVYYSRNVKRTLYK